MINLESKIEAVLFYKNEPVEIKKLSKIIGSSDEETKLAIKNLSESLTDRGICLMTTENEVCLATAPQMRDMIEQIARDEMSKEIGKAGLETLAIILYNGPVSRREIDHIRGVNSTFILRNLSIRGLIERDTNQTGDRAHKYRATLSLLAHLGITKIDDLPEFLDFRKKIEELNKIKDE